MKSIRGGFTVLEVLIVLAITGLLFISAVTLFRGKQTQTQFNQAMHDLESKIQSIANVVKSGSFPDSENYNCFRRGTGTPGLTGSGGSGTGKNEDCITLGRALHVVPDDGILYIYTVLGLRTAADGEPVSSIKEAGPSSMIGGHPQQTEDLTQEYKLLGGAKVVSSRMIGQAGAHDILGLYLEPQGSSSAGQGSTFTSLAYLFDSTTGGNGPRSANSRECIEQDLAGCTDPPTLGQWDLCVESGGGNQRASLSLIATPSGVNTKLTFEECT